MADETKLIISIETILRGLDKTLRGLSQVEKSLKRVAATTIGTQGSANINRATAATQRLQVQQQRAAITAQRLSQAQQAVNIRAQQLTNAQARASLATQRLTQAQQRLAASTATTTRQLSAQADAHVRVFRAIQQASQRTTQQILGIGNALRSVGQGLASLGATLTVGLTAPLVGLGAVSVDAAVRLDSLKRGLAAISGSTDEANRQLIRLTAIAKLPGIGFEEAIQGSIRLQAVGFSALEAERNLREFANAIALTGGGRDELARVTVQLGQLAAKGKVLSQDLRPIIEAAPAVGRALLQAFGTVNAADIQELGLTTNQFLETLVSELSRLPRAAAGAKNSFENFRDELFRAAATIGTALLPALTRLVELIGPVVTSLANAFAALPGPLQVIVVGVGALLAGLGPVLFVVGQLTLGIGRLLVGFIELNVAGIIPTIRNLRSLTAGTLGAAQAQRTLSASTALLGGGIGLLLTALAAVAAVFVTYKAFQKDSVTLSKEQVDALEDEINGLEQQARFLNSLKTGVARTADEQERLLEIYNRLNLQAQTRVTAISDEEKRLVALRAELEKLILLRQQEQNQQAAQLAGTLANTIVSVQANERERDAIAARVQANAALVETLEREQVINATSTRLLAQRGITASEVEAAIGALKAESETLTHSQNELINQGQELNKSAKEQAQLLQALERQTGLTARQLLTAAKSLGVFRGDIESTLVLLERYVERTDAATRSTDAFQRALDQQQKDLRNAGEQADAEAKRRRGDIAAAASIAREAADDFAGALKFMEAFIAAQPRLRADIERERQIQGKSLTEFLEDALGRAFGRERRGGTGTGLRNAQEQLAQALSDVAVAAGEAQVKAEKDKNDRLIDAAESAQRRQLLSYRQFLEFRAQLTAENLDREIAQQQVAVTEANKRQAALLLAAQKAGIPEAESVRRQAQAAAAQEEAIEAETKLTELQRQRESVTGILNQLIAEAQHQQLADVRQLEIQYAELQGRVEDALDATVVEEFRASLEDLTKAQEFLNRELVHAQKIRDADRVAQIKQQQALNQRQIEAIRNQVQARQALAQLAAAQELVRRAQERQRQLEADIAFEVEFRGLSEERAIARRLEGEERLNDSLTNAHETIRQIVVALQARGVEPPRALIEFLDQLETQTKGLAELPFSEQFRLAEQEFNRINDLRLQKIADVERAVRNRDIAEAEGLLLIRRINGEYVGDLERQVELLRQIAAASGDPALQRQAQDSAEIARDAADQLASLNRQIRATSIDALQDGFTNLFTDLADRSQSAKEDLLNFIDSVVGRINQVIAENLSRKLIESIFGGADEAAGGGILAGIKRLLGFGGGAAESAKATVAEVAGKVGPEVSAATAAATLQAGAVTAAATTASSAIAFATSVTTAAAAFTAAITAAGAAFAATVAAAGAAQATGGLAGLSGSGSGIGNFATGDILPARSGGRVVRVAEAGHAEAVLTTDPKHALRQARLLARFLKTTKGLGGRFPVPDLAAGAIVSPRDVEAGLLSGMQRTPLRNSNLSDVKLAAATDTGRFRFVMTDERSVADWLNSSEGEQVVQMKLIKNRPLIKDLAR